MSSNRQPQQHGNRSMPLPSAQAQVVAPEPAFAAEEASEKKEAAPVKSKGIEVVALQKGFYGSRRRSPGNKFFIRDLKELGKWMALVDKEAEKERRAKMKDKKAGD